VIIGIKKYISLVFIKSVDNIKTAILTAQRKTRPHIHMLLFHFKLKSL